MNKREIGPEERWSLYWVASDGFEDCFIAARNPRSACSVDTHMNGFDFDEVRAYRVCSIPASVALSYQSTEDYDDHPWPCYVYGKQLFENLGAEFRTIENIEEMLLYDVVYQIEDYVPCQIKRMRDLGPSGMSELIDEIKDLGGDREDRDDDIWVGRDVHIATMLGMCLVRCHQIEYYISKSFILGISEKQKKKYTTLRDMQTGWRKKTLGNMILCIKEAWDIDPVLEAGIEMFREMRNLLIHEATTHDKYDIQTEWGKKELIQFLRLFDIGSNVVRLSFRSSFAFSIAYALENFDLPEELSEFELSDEHEEEASMFPTFFQLKDGVGGHP